MSSTGGLGAVAVVTAPDEIGLVVTTDVLKGLEVN